MHELTRPLALVADDWRPRLEPVQATKALATQQGVDRRAGQARLPAQDVWPDPELPTPGAQGGDERRRVGAGLMVDGAAAVGETRLTLPPEASDPLGACLAADAGGLGRSGDRSA